MSDESTTTGIDIESTSTNGDSAGAGADDPLATPGGPDVSRRRVLGMTGAAIAGGFGTAGASGQFFSGGGQHGTGCGGSDPSGNWQSLDPVKPGRVLGMFLGGAVMPAIVGDFMPLSRGDLQVVSATPEMDGTFLATIDAPIGRIRYRHDPEGDSATVALNTSAVQSLDRVNFSESQDVLMTVDQGGSNVEYINRVPDNVAATHRRDLRLAVLMAVRKAQFSWTPCSGGRNGGLSDGGGQSTPGGRGQQSPDDGLQVQFTPPRANCQQELSVQMYELGIANQRVTILRDEPGGTAVGIRTPMNGGPVLDVEVASGPTPLLAVMSWIDDAVEEAWEKLRDAIVKILEGLPAYPEDFVPWSNCWVCCINDNTEFIENSDLSVQELKKRLQNNVTDGDSLTEAANEIIDIIKEIVERAGLGTLAIIRLVTNLVSCAWDCNPPGSTDEGCD